MRLSRIILVILSIFVALVLEWSIAGSIALFGVPIPFAVSIVIFLFWKVRIVFRIWLAVSAGIFFDALSIYPWGLFMIGFCIAAFIIEFLQMIFTPAHIYHYVFSLPLFGKFGLSGTDSILPQIIGSGVGIFIVLFLIFFGGVWIEHGASIFSQIPAEFLRRASSGFIFWSVFLPILLFCSSALVRKFRSSL